MNQPFNNPQKSQQPKKICPFMSNGDKMVPCDSKCMLFRQAKQGGQFQCPFQELPTISWNMKIGISNQNNGF